MHSRGRRSQKTLEGRELSGAIDRFMETLGKEERDLFAARYFFAASVKELAARTGTTEAAVSSRLSRIRRKLRNYLEEEGLL